MCVYIPTYTHEHGDQSPSYITPHTHAQGSPVWCGVVIDRLTGGVSASRGSLSSTCGSGREMSSYVAVMSRP